jgi:hypothetical protein
MEQAARVEAHPLAGSRHPVASLSVIQDTSTGEVADVSFEFARDDPNSWPALAFWERPLVWMEQEPIHLENLARAIGKEHQGLRELTKAVGRSYREWKRHVFSAHGRISQAMADRLNADDVIWFEQDGEAWAIMPAADAGPLGTLTEPGDGFQSDFDRARLYLNGRGWHADKDKWEQWDAADAQTRVGWQKMVEVRVVSGASLVVAVADAVRVCRAEAGYDF